MSKHHTISFVIPQKGRLDLLEGTLRSIASQSLGGRDGDPTLALEVVLMTQDHDPSDAQNLLKNWLKDRQGISFQVLEAIDPGLTISALRNQAAARSNGDLLAFVDADIQLSPDWASTMTSELLLDDSRRLVSAMQVVGAAPTVIEKIQVGLNQMRVDASVSALSGHNLFLSRGTFEAVGGFPEHLHTCEDSVFTDAVGQLGALYRSSKSSYVHLGEDRTFAQVFQKEKWRSHYNLATLFGRTVQPMELISFFAPAMVLFALSGAAVALIIGKGIWFLLLIGIGVLPVILYTVRFILNTGNRPGVLNVFRYYSVYFVARGLGMFMGVNKALKVRKLLSEKN